MRVGLQFKATMYFSHAPERQLVGEVIECEPERLLTLRFAGEASFGTGEYVDETYVFQPVEGGTKIVHSTDFSHSGLPWFLKAVLRVIHLVGRQEGKLQLEGLKELAEDSNR